MKHTILDGVGKKPNKWDNQIGEYEFYQLPKISGTKVYFDASDGVSGGGYKDLRSARSAFCRLNPKRGGYDIKWVKVNDPLTKADIYLMEKENDHDQRA